MTDWPDEIESKTYVDCGDNSCICCPKEEKTGMRTNGGCRCFRHGNFLALSSDENRKVRRAVLYWRFRVQEAEEEAAQLKDRLETWENSGVEHTRIKIGDDLDKEPKKPSMFDVTRHRVLKAMGEEDMGKSWSWIESRVAHLKELLEAWENPGQIKLPQGSP